MNEHTLSTQLIIANRELEKQKEEIEKRAAELIVANRELAFQNSEKEKRAEELLIANKELLLQNKEKKKKAQELADAYKELRKAEGYMKDHILGLEEMMFITSHKVRKPVANILGLSNLLEEFIRSPAKLRQLVDYLKVSAQELDDFTNELTNFISGLERKGRS